MYLEIINDLLMSSTIFYIFFGMLIVTIGISQLCTLQHGMWTTRTHINIRYEPTLNPQGQLSEHPMIENEPFIMWFVKSFKRIDKLDDDNEDNSTSCFIESFKIRGGRLWTKIVYSQPYGNMELY